MTAPSSLAGPPPTDTPVPAALLAVLETNGFAARGIRPVWLNGAGGLTFAIDDGFDGRVSHYAKWNPAGSDESLADEAERLHWIRDRHPVPVVVELAMIRGDEVLLTEALPGESAVSARHRQNPETALRALGSGLRRLHDIEPDDCPFDWSIERRTHQARIPVNALGKAPSIDRLVICQGDPCAPNTLLAADGSFLAHVDLARLGRADRWADLAVMSLSLSWNYRDCDESVFWDAYGIEPDPVRIDYYRRLWNSE